MTMQGAITELVNILNDKNLPIYYEPALKKVIETLEQEPCDDAISRQAAQDYIAKYLSQYLYNDVREAVEAIDEYIGELPPVTQKPETVTEFADRCKECGAKYGKLLKQEPCEDCISRREAIKMFTYNYKGERIPDYDCDNFPVQIAIKTVKEMLRELPSVNPQPKTGYWIEQIDHEENCRTLICSNCDRPALHDGDSIWKHKFCPHCGAKMVEPQESEVQDASSN